MTARATRIVFRNRLGRTVKMLRQAHDLSQQQLASKMLTTREVVSNLERGESLPTVVTLERASKALAVSPAVLLHLAEAA